jgi:hypothetical protein
MSETTRTPGASFASRADSSVTVIDWSGPHRVMALVSGPAGPLVP